MASILVVEDSPIVSGAMARLLAAHGYKVRVAGDGLVALSALRVFEPDLVLLDVRLPHIDGIQLCLVIRRLKPYADLPIIMLSGLTSQVDRQRALDAGANDYLVKPVDNDTLLALIAAQLPQHNPASIRQSAFEPESDRW
ncbi:MAG: response regulator [Anaerolineae bacterium]|nr:response regulator [Anaerolineae bacterium]